MASKAQRRFRQSQAAHERLVKKHGTRYRQNDRDLSAYAKMAYHGYVKKKQEREKRILTAAEKQKLFRIAEHDTFFD